MQAMRYHAHGPADVLVLEEATEPRLGPNEVLVKVVATSVNPADWKFRAGWFREWVPQDMPFIPGADVAGIVIARGALVRHLAVGDRVFGMVPVERGGASAQQAAVRGDGLALAPATIPLAHAAVVPLAALTAWSALFDHGGLAAGQTILIHAAAGGVGGFAVQLASIAGARVIATASAANGDLVRSLGADRVIDYRSDDFATTVRDADMVLDAVGGETQRRSFATLRPGGVLATLDPTPLPPELAAQHGIRVATVAVAPNGARLAQIGALIDAGALRIVIDSAFALADLAEAHRRSESGRARGKILVHVQDV